MEETMSTNKEIIWEENVSIEPEKNCSNNIEFVPNDITNITKTNSIKNLSNVTGKISGIYKIVNRVNGKYYIGSSNNIQKRWNLHLWSLRKGKHHNIHLQRAWNKYGEFNFDVIVIKISPIERLLMNEQIYLDICKFDSLNYNICLDVTAPFQGRKHSKLSILKIINSNIGNHNHEGRKNPMFGKTHSEKSKDKMKKSLQCEDVMSFKNIKTKEFFMGTRCEFISKFGLNKGNVWDY